MALANGRLYVGDYRGVISCIDALHGKLDWRFATGAQILATPVVTAGQVYIGSGDGNFYALIRKRAGPPGITLQGRYGLLLPWRMATCISEV